ncbi:hypothetical protein MOO44_04735 [Nicoliella spurrieriana]|uniref:Uncharacterized protein n=1 Tax=Nicoliella spurrieriana TaxID=2925830 RepID=A0A976X6K0_9LACO|nr:hypothetical protein [Nicoliella spurrieriana]UQS87464.1 hypothetical protein MOO44_04735 [Nicoliella spurrieriana]
MTKLNTTLITVQDAWAMLKDKKNQQNERFPQFEKNGKFILPDYKLTRKREAFKIRKRTFLKRHARSYVAFDSDNGQTLWLHNFPSLSAALFWLDTGLKTNDMDIHSSYQQWKSNHLDDINEFKDQLRKKSKHKHIPREAADLNN